VLAAVERVEGSASSGLSATSCSRPSKTPPAVEVERHRVLAHVQGLVRAADQDVAGCVEVVERHHVHAAAGLPGQRNDVFLSRRTGTEER
jgi:hypothetical protein